MRKKKRRPSKRPRSPQEQTGDTLTGILRMHPRGFGFVIPDHPSDSPQDVFIPKHLTQNAVDGDHVEVLVDPHSNKDKGPEGKIIAVLKRGRTHLAGTVRAIDGSGAVLVHVPILGSSKPVILEVEEGTPLRIGDRVIMKVAEWNDSHAAATCELVHVIGHISDPACDVPAAAEEFDLRDCFPAPALEEARAFGARVSPKDLHGREDLTSLECFTIDPKTARDYDDALSLRRSKKGGFHLGVHIADAAHYVQEGSALDLEAARRCNSTYFPGCCLPMLPEELSSNLCSLRAQVIRLTVSVLMDFDEHGALLSYRIARSYIKSARRFTYEEAKEVLDGKRASKYAPTLRLMTHLCALLKKQRAARGSIDFSLPDLAIEVDEKGQPTGLSVVEYDVTHQLVEEFMLKANEVVATHLAKEGKALLYRIHEEPSAENMQEFYALARGLGFPLPEAPSTQELQALFDQAKSTPYSHQLAVGFIRSLKLAYYSSENVGHFGLALEHYCHFTSPIRRYTDLVIQRILFGEQIDGERLDKIALKCSEQERVSFRAEMSVKTLKKLRLLKRFLDENPSRIYPATITRIKPFGLYFEVQELALEGFLHISELEDDFFIFNPRLTLLSGRDTGKKHRVGSAIAVRAAAVDFILLESKWELALQQRS